MTIPPTAVTTKIDDDSEDVETVATTTDKEEQQQQQLDANHCSKKKKVKTTTKAARWAVLTFLGIAITTVFIAIGFICSNNKNNNNEKIHGDYTENLSLSSSSDENTDADEDATADTTTTASCISPPRCFANRQELDDAIFDYLSNDDDQDGGSLRNTVIAQYGEVRHWCFDATLTDFSFLFADMEISMFDDDSLECWNMEHALTTVGMFRNCQSFQGTGLASWDVSSLVHADFMFQNAASFREDLYAWNVRELQTATYMFAGATHFASDLCDWGPKLLKAETDMSHAFDDTACPAANEPSKEQRFSNGFTTVGPLCFDYCTVDP